jgi:hypothetical protein
MFAHIILNYLQGLEYLLCHESGKEYVWSITDSGVTESQFQRLLENNPWCVELYF